jgi:peptide deformylase
LSCSHLFVFPSERNFAILRCATLFLGCVPLRTRPSKKLAHKSSEKLAHKSTTKKFKRYKNKTKGEIMAIRNVVQVGDEVLRKRCFEVETFDESLHTLLDDMKDTVKKEQGAGLAAPQVGVLRRVVVVDVEEGYFELINPVILSQKGEQTGWEGCLSVKGKSGGVSRPMKVKIRFQDRNGETYLLQAKGFFARAICHELDHLDGVLYIDKATHIEKA